MREMKDSGIEWIGMIPQKWRVIPFTKALLSIVDYRGKTPQKTGDGTFLVTAKNIKNGKIDYEISKEYVRTEDYDEIMHRGKLEKGDVLFTTEAPLGEVANVDRTDIALAQRVIKFSGKKDIIDNYFLKYWIFSSGFQNNLQSFATGSTAKGIKASKLGKLKIIIPPLLEQKKIVEFLDQKCSEIDALYSNIEQQIATLEEYKKSVITEAVTKGLNPDVEMKDSGIEWIGMIPKHWTVKRIKNIGEYRNGLTYTPLDITDETNGTLVLRSSNVQNGKIVYDDNVYVKSSIKSELKIKKGDILVCSRNGSRELIGKNAVIEEDIEASFGAFMMIFRCNYPKYMYYILNSYVFSYYLGSFFTSTINQLTGNNFGNIKIVFCNDIAEQNKIVNYLDQKCSKIGALIKEKKEQLTTLEEYKKSLIYEYVTGKKEVK